MTKEEAIRGIKTWKLDPDDMEILSAAIPELKESEDERIRKALIQYLKDYPNLPNGQYSRATFFAYLERQKEYVSENFDDIWETESCKELLNEGQKLTPKFKELLKEICHSWYDKGIEVEKQKESLTSSEAYMKGFSEGVEAQKEVEQKPTPDWMPKFLDELRSKNHYFDWDEHRDIEGQILAIIKWIAPDYFNRKEKEQKFTHHEVNESLQSAVAHQMEDDGDVDDFVRKGIDDIVLKYAELGARWQKEQKLELCDMGRWDEQSYNSGIHHVLQNPEAYGLTKQKPAEWSEEDKAKKERLISIVKRALHGNEYPILNDDGATELITWLKSLHTRHTWKPSEEQMGALNYAYCELFKREDVGHNILSPLQSLIDTLSKL